MSTDKQIAEVYREDKKDPFYSVQGGSRKRKRAPKDRPERTRSLSMNLREFGQTDPAWIWGHLKEALIRAGIE